MEKSAKLTIGDKTIELPIIESAGGDDGIDISSLRAQTGLVTYDGGYANTSATQSSITYLDGEKGILRYRGYDISDLCEQASFLEVAFLLIRGHLPTPKELRDYEDNIKEHTMINEDFKRYYDVWPRTAHPMGLLSSAVGGLSSFYSDSLDPHDPEQVHISTIRLMAKLPTLAAYAYKKFMGQPFVYPLDRLKYCENFLNMMFSVPTGPYEIDKDMVNALNQLLVIHADHEQNCSTSTVRIVGSTHANMFASVAAGINALWGPKHGGANQAVLEMLQTIHEEGRPINTYIERAKNKKDPFKLMGFGHRVYKNFDPRARIIKKSCDLLLAKMGKHDPLLDIAKELEEIALSDDYFIEKKLYPNVDFYSGIIYKAMGFPVNMFTVLFSLGRLPGWIAQWREMIQEEKARIARPRQIYTGEAPRPFVELDKR